MFRYRINPCIFQKTWRRNISYRTPNHYWSSPERQKQFFERIAKQLNIKSTEDWYKINLLEEIKQRGGSSFLKSGFQGSPIKALQAAYPEQTFYFWKFDKVPGGKL